MGSTMATPNTQIMSKPLLYTVGVAVGAVMISGITHLYYKYWKKQTPPQKWRRVGTLQQINLFPVKSCAPLELSASDLQEMFCEVLGLRKHSFRDRGLMLVDDKNDMITARVYPKFVLIRMKILTSTKLLLTAPEMEDIEMDFCEFARESGGKDIHTAVWGSQLDAMLCGEKYDRWFSRYLLGKESGVHLVYYPYPKPVRSINSRMTREPYITQADSGCFGDATSYMLMNLSSVKDLNAKLTRPVDPLQFRGNFHLQMDEDSPYVEDKWQWVRIGEETIFRKVAPCTRCIFPNINAQSGERDPDGEPLKTLKSYRMFKGYGSPALGVHLAVRQEGAIKLNDVIYVEDK